jgi:hypothetical protein
MTNAPEETGKKQNGARWPRGRSGNPNGRPRGSRSHVLAALDQIGAENAEAILQKAVEQAKNGDQRSMELILSRVWPAQKGAAGDGRPATDQRVRRSGRRAGGRRAGSRTAC